MPDASSDKPALKAAEVCRAADVAPYVLKYWLTEFPCLSAEKEKGPNRLFSSRDVRVISRIRQLLYDEGFTIAGAKKKIDAELSSGAFDLKAGGKKKASGEGSASAPALAPVPVLDAPPIPAAQTGAAAVDARRIARELREILKILPAR
jgi:DNA-binding transcriptional MerR regulator